MSKGIRQQTGYGFFVAVLRIMFGAIFLAAGTVHFIGGQGTFEHIVTLSGSGIGSWVAANASFMYPFVYISMWLTGVSLVFGFLGRLGSFAMALFAIFFILGVGLTAWIGDLSMLGVAIGFIIVGPGRYFGLDTYFLQRVPGLRFLA
jgi:uncharacterized membrane protein YphA (DoxX/SURF4 family)